MRATLYIVKRRIAGCAAVLTTAALLGLAPAAHAQQPDDAVATPLAMATASVIADVMPALRAAIFATPLVAAPLEANLPKWDDGSTGSIGSNETSSTSNTAFAFPRAAHNGGDVIGDISTLDDQTLAHQRGGAVGMVMVAATPQLMSGNSVTLWDEIAPPAPLPIPVDSSQNAQGNVTNYTRR